MDAGRAFRVSLAAAVAAAVVGVSASASVAERTGPTGPVERPSSDCTLIGTPRDDVLRGTSGADVICGLGGDDVILGRGGDDRLRGGLGNDRLRGGAGDDLLRGGAAAGTLSRRRGSDDLRGGPGADRLWGEGGRDDLTGGKGPDTLRGGTGTDRLDALDAPRPVDLVDCGGGAGDLALADDADRVDASCERYPGNRAPIAIELSSNQVAENKPAGTTVGTLSATDPNAADTATFALVAGAGDTDNAAFRITATRLVTAAVFDFETKNSYSVRIRATDSRGASRAEAFTITITDEAENETPVAADGTRSTDEDTPVALDLAALADDAETADADLTYEIVTAPAHGTATTTTYTPDPDFNGSDSLTYRVTDRGNPDGCSPGPACAAPRSATGTVTVTVDPVDDAPTAASGSRTTAEDAPVPLDLGALVADVETSDADLTYEIITGPAHGTATATTYTPDLNFNGIDSLTYRVTDRGDPDDCGAPAPGCDGARSSSTETVSITVDPVDDTPLAPDVTLTTDEDAPLAVDLQSLTSDVETSDADLRFTVSGPAHGALTGTGGSRTYTPDPDFAGTDSLTYTVTDRGDPDNCPTGPGCDGPESATGTVTVTVGAVNDAPVNTVPAGPVAALPDTDHAITGLAVTDVDAGTDPVEVTLAVDHGTLTLDTTHVDASQIADNGTGMVVVTASLDAVNATLDEGVVFHGSANDTLTMTTDDLGHSGAGGARRDIDTLAITVNSAPVATAQSVTTEEDLPRTITLSARDADGDTLTFAIASSPTHGTLGTLGSVTCAVTPNVCTVDVSYTPDADYSGSDDFTFTADDSVSTSTPATVSITVGPVNDPPALQGIEAGALSYTENDAPTDLTAISTVTDPDSANFDTGTLTVDLSAGGTADDRLEIRPQGQIALTGSTVTYGGTPIGTLAGGAGTTPLVVTLDADATPAATQALVRAVAYSNVSDDPSTAARTVRFVLTDGDGGTSAPATRAITVTAVDDPPALAGTEAAALAYTENDPATPVTASLTVADPDSDLTGATVAVTGGFTRAEDVLAFTDQAGITGTYNAGTGVLTLTGSATPVQYQTALRSVTYRNTSDSPSTATRTATFQVTDGPLSSNVSSRDVTVTAVNDAPVADDETFDAANSAIGNTSLVGDDPTDGAPSVTTPRKTITADLLAGDTDPEGQTLVVQPVTDQATDDGGRVTVQSDGDFVYTPAAGTSCSDHSDFFTYTVSDQNPTGPGPTPGTDTGKVTIAITDCVWYVDNARATDGDGRSDAPFNTLASLQGVSDPDGPGDVVYISKGSSSYAGGLALEANQRLVGAAQDLTVGGTALATGNAADRPTITNAGGAGVTLQSGSTVTGLAVSGASGAAIAGTNAGGSTVDDVRVSGANGGVALTGAAAGTFTFTDIAITTTGGTGFRIASSASPTVNVGSPATESVSTTGGSGVDIGTLTGSSSIVFDSVTASGGTSGISVASTGAVNASFGTGSISGSTADLAVNGGSGTISYSGILADGTGLSADISNRSGGSVTVSGNITDGTDAGGGITMAANSGGSTTFSGPTKTLNTGVSRAFSSTGTGHTITLSGGGLDIDTTTGAGFTATGGGTVTVTGSGNTIDTGAATALNVTATGIGAGGLTFQRISSNGGSDTGIILDTTGSNGGVAVTGAGTAGSGGTIANKTGADGSTSTGTGIYLNSTQGASFAQMQLNDFANFAIRGTGVRGLTLADSRISGSNGTSTAADEAAVAVDDLTGSASLTNDNISGGVEDGVRIQNATGSLNSLTITGSTFATTGAATANDALALLGRSGASVFNATVQGNTFTRAQGDLFQYTLVTGTGTMHFDSNTVTNSFPTALPAGGGDINVSSASTASARQSLQYSVNNNSIYAAGTGGQAPNGSVVVVAATPQGSATGTIQNNTIGTTGVTQSGGFDSILVDAVKAGFHQVTITGNTIRRYKEAGIRLLGVSPAPSPGFNLRATVKGNTILEPDSIAFAGIDAEVGADPADVGTMCLDLGGATAAEKNSVVAGDPTNFNDINVIQQFATGMSLPGYGGAPTDDAAVQVFLAARNDGNGTPTVFASHDTTTGDGNAAGTGFTGTGTNCS